MVVVIDRRTLETKYIVFIKLSYYNLINISTTLRKAVVRKSRVFINVAVTIALNFREQLWQKNRDRKLIRLRNRGNHRYTIFGVSGGIQLPNSGIGKGCSVFLVLQLT